MIEVNFSSMPCPHYTEDGKEIEKTIVVGPIRLFESSKEAGMKSYDLVIGCNYFRGCENKRCAYSWVSRQERKNIVRQVPT